MTQSESNSIEPSSEQASAIISTSNKICILACAGSGKTFTLTRKISRTVDDLGIVPSEIAAITFTNLAANRLKLELSTLLKRQSAVSQMFVGTIHSFCLHLLQNYFNTELDEFNILTDSKQFVLLNKYWNEWNIGSVEPGSNKSSVIEKLIVTFDIVKMEGISLEIMQMDYPDIYRVFETYESYLARNNYWDYTDLVSKTNRLLKEDVKFKSSVFDK